MGTSTRVLGAWLACAVFAVGCSAQPDSTADAAPHLDTSPTLLDGATLDTGDCDRDGDHVDAIACGGTDCADDDRHRFPGNTEVCDVAGVDEDCDPSTFGFRDLDGDGFADAACCNHEGATPVCGPDCNDAAPGVHESAPEVCNEIDDDCDGAMDEMLTVALYRDADSDGFGAAADTVRGCPGLVAGYVADGTDCDDARTATHPGATDACNGIDDDCALPVDPPTCACTDGDMLACGYSSAAATHCAPVMGTCRGGALDCPPGLITGGEAELCNGMDDNCNGITDEALVPPASAGLPLGQCYMGLSATINVGTCHAGTWVCHGSAGWGDCDNDVVPQDSSVPQCNADLDCDGNAFENVPCSPPGSPAGSPAPTRTATACTASGIQCAETCSASCAWPTECTLSPVSWDYLANVGGPVSPGACAAFCGDYGICSTGCVAGQDIAVTVPNNLPPGTYTADAWLGGTTNCSIQLIAATWDGATQLGTPMDNTFLNGALHTVTVPFNAPSGAAFGTCAPPISIFVHALGPCSFIRVADIAAHRVGSTVPGTAFWP